MQMERNIKTNRYNLTKYMLTKYINKNNRPLRQVTVIFVKHFSVMTLIFDYIG